MMYSKGQINTFTITIVIIGIILLIVIALYVLGRHDEPEETMNARINDTYARRG